MSFTFCFIEKIGLEAEGIFWRRNKVLIGKTCCMNSCFNFSMCKQKFEGQILCNFEHYYPQRVQRSAGVKIGVFQGAEPLPEASVNMYSMHKHSTTFLRDI